MGSGFNQDVLFAERSVIFFVVGLISFGCIVKYMNISIDSMAFGIFALMCMAGVLAYKTAKEIAAHFEEQKVAFETLKSSAMYVQIAPVAFNTEVKPSKYVTSDYVKSRL